MIIGKKYIADIKAKKNPKHCIDIFLQYMIKEINAHLN
jgi:hypothetical protein